MENENNNTTQSGAQAAFRARQGVPPAAPKEGGNHDYLIGYNFNEQQAKQAIIKGDTKTINQLAAIDARPVIGECEFCGVGYKQGDIKCPSCSAALPVTVPGKLSKKEMERREAERKAAAEAEKKRKAELAEKRKARRKKIMKIALPCAAAVLAAVMGVIIGVTAASAARAKKPVYDEYNDGYMISGVGAKYAAAEFVIPSEYKGKPVTKIGADAFRYNKTLKTVTISASVKEIGGYAFSECTALEKVVFEEGANPSLGDSVFNGCGKLTEITIPGSMKTIGESMLCGTGFTSFTIPSSVTKIEHNAFNSCGSLESVTFASGSNPSLGKNIFWLCGKLSSVSLPSSMKSLGEGMFGKTALKFVNIPAVAAIPAECFTGCSQLKVFYVKSGTQTVGKDAFTNCPNLKQLYYEGATIPFLNLNSSGNTPIVDTFKNIADMSSDGTLFLMEYLTPYDGKYAVGATCLFGRTSYTLPTSVNGKTIIGYFDNFGATNLTIPSSVLYKETL